MSICCKKCCDEDYCKSVFRCKILDPHITETFGEIKMEVANNKLAEPLISESVDIDETLKERGSRYGEFDEHARITQGIKRAMIDSPNWLTLTDDKKEALEMVAHKIGRILNGDPEYADSWHDIIGYTKLVENTLDV